MKRPIRIERIGKARRGYRVLITWRRPPDSHARRIMDAWIPELAPSHILRWRYDSGIYSWGTFLRGYGSELRYPFSQNILKPLALLSRRRVLVLLCDCADAAQCHHKLVARVVAGCRRRRNFTLRLGRSS